ncbi:MAG: methionine--tRNA ligase [Halobacteriota archaeon]
MTSLSNKPLLITCGLPYANGPCHIGHLRTYIPADIYVRCLKKLQQDPLFVCGSDTHGTPIVINAEQQGTTPAKLAAYYHRYWEDTFKALSVDFSHYGNTDAPTNHFRTQEIVKSLQANGCIYPLVIRLAYCPECDRFLPDRYVEGACFFCGMPARGDECDQGCGRHLEPGEIVDPTCKTCGASAEYREEQHYFFRLSAFKDFLLAYLESLGGTANARNYAREWVSNELKDWCITRNLGWGVTFPGTDLVVYVWVDAPIGYISFTEEATSAWEDYWKSDSNIIHFIGTDIIYQHAIFWPALLKGASYTLPAAIVASGMVKVDGKTFSKSRGFVVWVDEDYLDHGFHPDLLRFYLASYTSHTKELNFSWQVFGEKVNRELVGSLGNFIYRTLHFAYKNFGRVPEGPVDAEIMERVADTREKMVSALKEYEFKKVVDAAMSLSDFGNAYFQSKELWNLVKSDRTACARELKNCIQLVKALSVLLEPVMPSTMRSVQAQLGLTTTYFYDATVEVEPLRLPKPALPFAKIDEKKIGAMEAILNERIARADHKAPAKEPSTGEAVIKLDDFKKMDLRIARIVEAEPVQESDKLLKITAQVGEETRQIVAGIAKDYAPEDLIGTDVVVLVNLQPVKLMGIESRGMLLVAENDGQSVLIRPARRMPSGTRIR